MDVNPASKLRERYGSNGKVAEEFKITKEAARLWTVHCIPADRALEVEEKTNGEIGALEILRYARKRQKKRKNGLRRAA